jgi:purine-nucleoside phosphorylase
VTAGQIVGDPFAAAATSARELAERTGVGRHDVAVVLGSGWQPAAERLGEVVAEVDLADLAGFPCPTVEGHVARVRSIAATGGRRLLAFLGRVHGYEGHGPATVVHGVRTAAAAGCRTIVLTNAAGALRNGLSVGDAVLIADHLDLSGGSPLRGPNRDDLGPRFVDLTHAWSPRLRSLAQELHPSLPEGVYGCLAGPQYETPAEIRMLRMLGVDLVGMSTVPECVAAVHLGLEVLGLSLVTNLAAGVTGEGLDHADVLAAGVATADRNGALIGDIVARL